MLRKIFTFSFATSLKNIPIVNLENYSPTHPDPLRCLAVASAFREYGCVIIKDGRIDEEKNMKLISTMKKYYRQRQAMLDRGQQPQDIFKELDYQIGLSPPGVIKLQNYSQVVEKFSEENKPMTPYPPRPSRTFRYLWNIGEEKTQLANRPPSDFPHFQQTLNGWGNHAFDICITLTQMLELGLQLPHGSFSHKLKGGANKLAPNGFDLTKCEPNQPFIGLHFDYGFLTIHGKSSFPGLFVWLSNGKKIKVRVPSGHLFIQAGSELEYMTGGYIKSGLHQAINTSQVQGLAKEELESGGNPWRINSTIFTHFHPDSVLQPLDHFSTEETRKIYPPVTQSQFMMSFLKNRQA